MDFEGFLCKPKDIGQRATLDSFNEMIREQCHQFVEKYQLKLNDGILVTGPALYGSVMEMIINSINEIDQRGDSLFIAKVSDTQLRKAKSNKKKKLNDLNKIKEEMREIDIELEKQKVIRDTKREMANKLGLDNSIQYQSAPTPVPQVTTDYEPVRSIGELTQTQTTQKNVKRGMTQEEWEAKNLDRDGNLKPTARRRKVTTQGTEADPSTLW